MYWFTSKNKISLFILFTLLCPTFVFAQNINICSKIGYTVMTVNGIFTDEQKAKNNKDKLLERLFPTFNNEPVYIDYLFNPSHGKGVIDLADAMIQKVDLNIWDHDLVDIINDAHKKVKTQKLLLVAHSQGNFYANNFIDKVAGINKVPFQTIGIYGVATPTSSLGKWDEIYLTSSTDSVINKVRAGGILDVLPANDTIDLSNDPGSNGHSFVDVYLKYRADKMVNQIKKSLDGLLTATYQSPDGSCIPAPDITILHQAVSGVLVFVDHPYDVTKKGVGYVWSGVKYLASGFSSFAKSLFGNKNDLATNVTASAVDSMEINENETTEVANTSQEEENQNTQVVDEMGDPYDSLVQQNVPVTETLNLEEKENGVAADTLPVEPVADPNTYGFSTYPSQAQPPVEVSPPTPTPDTTPPVITLNGDASIYVTKNSVYTDAGATANDVVDGAVSVSTSGSVDTSTNGTYVITYTATDAAHNTATATRNVKVATRVYVSKYHFGSDNGDGNDWQAWYFNGSEIYDWNDNYVNNYLHETFKVQQVRGSWCSQCLQRGIFNHNPELGFEPSDVAMSLFNADSNVQTNNSGLLYNVDIQWDATGYTYLTTEDNGGAVHSTAHVNVANIDTNTYVGWDDSFNNFQTFPSGNWMGVVYPSSTYTWSHDYTGGGAMILKPYPVYVP